VKSARRKMLQSPISVAQNQASRLTACARESIAAGTTDQGSDRLRRQALAVRVAPPPGPPGVTRSIQQASEADHRGDRRPRLQKTTYVIANTRTLWNIGKSLVVSACVFVYSQRIANQRGGF
jgi:hypothetical protein